MMTDLLFKTPAWRTVHQPYETICINLQDNFAPVKQKSTFVSPLLLNHKRQQAEITKMFSRTHTSEIWTL